MSTEPCDLWKKKKKTFEMNVKSIANTRERERARACGRRKREDRAGRESV